mmetsp:Transcript_2703/g.4020  ORF Transcript_2703/g.4020 Transcript_2703/m.4020 type:complete len:91 (+) Transcript_2703:311-583(+)|eukprot:CAMPEP_0194215742 /NCGR_PEP_ID=MMETSP0156-20130528/17759_1 /TAXON_ID=33649 /ORGANISM="Thalassionema nitzschioides, Strain L26-B" /LENGTH=90 /DNA_ID=CAMNT_0038944341 /DNA_START=243 /DNA_END=515 /DNA_ORIENTATION=-
MKDSIFKYTRVRNNDIGSKYTFVGVDTSSFLEMETEKVSNKNESCEKLCCLKIYLYTILAFIGLVTIGVGMFTYVKVADVIQKWFSGIMS